jgi:tetratricopeptide (TPR) repeat protein
MCVLRAVLDGYRSETKPLVKGSLIAGAKLGRFVLQPSSSDPTGVASASGEQASKAGKKAYEQALYDAARQYWKNALKSFQKAVLSDPGYSSAWLSLGILQQSSGDREGARKSFAESAQADGKFALPLIRTAVLDAARADWQGTVDYSQKAIDLNPTAFPHAYELNAIGNLYLLKTDAAEKSAAKGLKLDTERRYPELEYALGMILKLKNDREGAAKHFQAYVDEAPSAAHVASAKAELARLQAPH